MSGIGVAYPADAVAGAPQFAAVQARNSFSAAMGGATVAKPLGGFTGVRPGTRADLITATSTTWTMNPVGCAGYIEIEASGTNSGYFFSFSGTVTGSVVAAGGSARTDLVYVQINDSNTSDGSTGAPRVVMDYISNYPTTALPARAFAIAQINVPASGGGSPTVTWIGPYTVAAGGILPAATSAAYPAAATYPGQYVDDLSLGGLVRSNGSTFTPVSGGLVPIVPTSVVGGTVSGFGAVTFATATGIALNGVFTSAFDNYAIVLDVPTHSTGAQIQFRLRLAGTDDSTASAYQTQITTNTGTTVATTQVVTTAGNLTSSGASTEDAVRVDVFAPALARPTRWESTYFSVVGSILSGTAFGRHTQSTAYDGIDIVAGTGTITGTVHVYGYVK